MKIPPWYTCVKQELDHAGCTRAYLSSCARTSYIQLAQGNTYMCGKNDFIVSSSGSAEEPHCFPLPRSSSATELRELLPPTSAMLMLMFCFSSAWLCACGVEQCVRGSYIGSHQERQLPRVVVSYVAPVSHKEHEQFEFRLWYRYQYDIPGTGVPQSPAGK